MKIFLSQPMNGRSLKEVMDERCKVLGPIIASIKAGFDLHDHIWGDDTIEIIDSIVAEDPPSNLEDDQIGIWYLSKSIEKMVDADFAIFFPGWNTARGCRIEELVANQYTIPCSYLGGAR